MTTPRLLTIFGLLLGLLLLPGAARAETYCVHQGPYLCLGSIDKGADLQGAISDAAATLNQSTIHLGPGTYTAPPGEHFQDFGTHELDIIGSNTQFDDDATVITAPSPGANPVLAIQSTKENDIESLKIRIPAGDDLTGLQYVGTATDVTVTRTPGGTGGIGVRTVGGPGDPSAFVSGRIAMGSQGTGFRANTLAPQTVERSTITAQTGVLDPLGPATVTHSTITAAGQGINLSGALAAYAIDNVLVRITGGGPLAQGIAAYNSVDVDIKHATVIGPGSGAGISSVGASPGTLADLDLSSSIVEGFAQDLTCYAAAGALAKLKATWSRFDTLSDASCSDSDAGVTNTDKSPNFVDPTVTVGSPDTDFHLRWDSEMIDAGDPADVTGGVDLSGLTRRRNGNGVGGTTRDPGAFEYQRLPPNSVADAPGSALAGEAVSFTAIGSTDPDPGDQLSFAWSFDDGETGTGAQVSHAFAAGGLRAGTVKVTDPTGLSDSSTAKVQVAAAPVDPAPNPTPPAGPSGGSPGGGGSGGGGGSAGASDTEAPVISALRFKPARFALAKGRTALAARTQRGTSIRFGLSESARVRLRFHRVAKGRPARHIAAGTLTRKGRAGLNTVRFTGRIGRRALAPGTYRLTIEATDSAGNRARPRTIRFKVVAR